MLYYLCNMKKIVEYKVLHYRKDGTLVSDRWELTEKEYQFYKVEMPRRVKRNGSGNRFEFVKIEPKTIEYSNIPGI